MPSNSNFATHLSVSVLQPRSIKGVYADTLEVNWPLGLYAAADSDVQSMAHMMSTAAEGAGNPQANASSER